MQPGELWGENALAWQSAEAGSRLTVCVSGLGGGAGEWNAVGPSLARHGHVIATELEFAGGVRSRGGSFRTALEALDQAVASAREGSVLIGHSMGALASMLIASSQLNRLGGLVLTSPFVPPARNGRSTLAAAADYARHRAHFFADSPRRIRHASVPTVSRRTRAAGLGALALYGLRPAVFHDLADRVDCQVLLVHGDNDHYVPPAFARAAAARHPTWQIAVIAGAGHFVHRDDPKAWLTAVDPWLGRLRSG